MAKRLTTLPINDGYFALSKINQHLTTWIAWPERTDNWRYGAKPIQNWLVKLIQQIIAYEPVTVLVSQQQWQNARYYLPAEVQVLTIETNECLIQDYGPYFLTNGKILRGLKSNFNAWGGVDFGVYYPWNADNQAAYQVFDVLKLDYYELPIVLEWGMIMLDGNGTCFANEAGILSPYKNENLTKIQAENYLKQYLNVNKIIWLPYSLMYDETKGRLDYLMTFADTKTILCTWTDNESDDNYQVLATTYKILKAATNQYDEKYKVYKIPLPTINARTQEETEMIDQTFSHNMRDLSNRLIGSYTSLYCLNQAVLVPTFADETTENLAIETIAKCFPNHRIILIDMRELMLGNASLSSIFCFQPTVTLNPEVKKYSDHI